MTDDSEMAAIGPAGDAGGPAPGDAPELLAAPPSPPPPPLRTKPAVWPAYVLPLAAMLGMFAAGIILGVAMGVYAVSTGEANVGTWIVTMLQRPEIQVLMLAMGIVVQAIVLAIFLVVGRLARGARMRERLMLVRPRASVLAIAIFGLGAVALSSLFAAATVLLKAESKTLESLSRTMSESRGATVWWTVLVIAVGAPIIEELVFRGYVQSRLVARHGAVIGIGVTSLMFGVYHLDLVQGLYAAALGVFLGLVAWRTRSVVPAIVGHAAANGFATAMTLLAIEDRAALGWMMLLSSGIILPASLFLLWKMPGMNKRAELTS